MVTSALILTLHDPIPAIQLRPSSCCKIPLCCIWSISHWYIKSFHRWYVAAEV